MSLKNRIEALAEEFSAGVLAAIRSASDDFQGTSYNLLTKNCNHFTSHLCKTLTGDAGPGWLNRAASIGVAMPCVVPREWIDPPDHNTAEGELLDEDGEPAGERDGMLGGSRPRLVGDSSHSDDGWESDDRSHRADRASRDSAGRKLPRAERAPAH